MPLVNLMIVHPHKKYRVSSWPVGIYVELVADKWLNQDGFDADNLVSPNLSKQWEIVE